MLDEELLQETEAALATRWQLPQRRAPEQAGDWSILLAALRERIAHLMIHNPRKLMTALYILDISEQRYLQALDQPTHEDRAHDLAQAILERETEKIATRRRYAREQAGGDRTRLYGMDDEGHPR